MWRLFLSIWLTWKCALLARPAAQMTLLRLNRAPRTTGFTTFPISIFIKAEDYHFENLTNKNYTTLVKSLPTIHVLKWMERLSFLTSGKKNDACDGDDELSDVESSKSLNDYSRCPTMMLKTPAPTKHAQNISNIMETASWTHSKANKVTFGVLLT